jgi:solute carrier family 34 (sodium-dependent phosphate cotransporter)
LNLISHLEKEEEEKKHKNDNIIIKILKPIIRIVLLLACLYFFIVSLDLMSKAFQLIAGKYASEAFKSDSILGNPFAGLVLGIASTAILQSSSTSTSIVISIVASGSKLYFIYFGL